ncbi:hypothetical protein G5V59_12645 [Nocardioides sp. W3-2-3]|nr:hypothetical protein [Nocardioides convexus]
MSAGGNKGHPPRKRHHDEEHDEAHADERWLVTYADMVTLLMVLFIVMFAMSTVDEKKYEQTQGGTRRRLRPRAVDPRRRESGEQPQGRERPGRGVVPDAARAGPRAAARDGHQDPAGVRPAQERAGRGRGPGRGRAAAEGLAEDRPGAAQQGPARRRAGDHRRPRARGQPGLPARRLRAGRGGADGPRAAGRRHHGTGAEGAHRADRDSTGTPTRRR